MEFSPNREAFERVRDQIGFCGIWCGSCAVGNGGLTQLAGGLRQLLADYDVPRWTSVEIGWEAFLKALDSLKQGVSCAGCREGGGRDNCEIRACALGRGLKHCTDCASFPSCDHSAIMDHMRSGAAKIGLSVLMPGQNPDSILQDWTRALPARWPCCIVFAESK
jgi:hypothetical protein